MDDEQRERDKASAQAYYDQQKKKLANASSDKVEHYTDKVERTRKAYKREYNERPNESSSSDCRIS